MSSSWRTFWMTFLCAFATLAVLYSFSFAVLAEEPPAEESTPEIIESVPELPPEESAPEESTPELPPEESAPEESMPEVPPEESVPESMPEESSSVPELLPEEGENNGGIVPGSKIDIYDPNITVSEAIFQIRYVFLFLVFGVIPLVCSCVILFVFFRWIYRIVLGSV